MKITIAFLASAPFHPYMDDVVRELANYCDIIFVTAATNDEADRLYGEYAPRVDCFIFSGKILYYAVTTRRGDLEKPIYVLDDQKGDIKDVFLALLLADRNFDFSRVFVDFAFGLNGYLGIKEMLPEKEWPHFSDVDEGGLETFADVEKLCDAIKRRHYELHRAGLVDLSLTRLGLLPKEFERDGIPYRYVYPSKDYILNFFLQIVSAFNSNQHDAGLAGSIVIIPMESAEGADGGRPAAAGGPVRPSAGLDAALASLVRRHGYDFTVQWDGGTAVVLTKLKDLEALTGGFANGSFKEAIEGEAGQRTAIGMGAGRNFYQAKLNALKAAELSRYRSGEMYYISETDRLVGPLGARGTPGVVAVGELRVSPTERLVELSRGLHVDHLSLQKIIILTKMRQSTRVSADELAAHLGVTLRSANRLLNKIEANGGATSFDENLVGGRGRPRKYYDITFKE
ncbi:MAG: hypothetical protein M0001_07290 [Treponema sp.]|nr:hypothetical protein [Treponema sp.]